MLGALNLDQNYFLKSIYYFKNQDRAIAITFDDAPSASHTEKILSCLEAHQIHASFFVIGQNILGNEDLVKKIHDNGHALGNHSFHHDVKLTFKPSKKIKEDIEKANSLIESVIGSSVKYYRPPFGVTNPNIAKIVNSLGLISVGWTVRSFDTYFTDADKIAKRMMKKIKPGSILLFHDNQDVTLEVLNIIIPELKNKNYMFNTIDEIF